MVMAVDTSGITGVKSLRSFQVENQLENQKINAGNIDNANKANLYATQVLTGAIASGDQATYDNAKAHLAGMGIDTTNLAPDIATGAKQVDASRQAQYSQNPLLAALGLGLKADGNVTSAANAMGSAAGGAALAPTSAAIAQKVAGIINAPGTVPADPARNPGLMLPGATGGLAAPAAANPNAIVPDAPPSGFSTAGSALPNVSADPRTVAAPTVVSAPAAPAMPVGAIDANGSTAQQFVPPAPVAGETAKMHQDRIENALAAWRESPAKKQADASAAVAGKDQGAQPMNAANSQEITDRLEKNIQALLDLNDHVPDSAYLGPETKAMFSKRIGSGADAGALGQWEQIDQQQILSDFAQLVNSGQIKSNRTLVQMLQTGSGVPADMPRAARADLLNNLLSEVKNKNTTVQNVNSRLNGGAVTPYQDVLQPGNSAITRQATAQDIAKIPTAAVKALSANPDAPDPSGQYKNLREAFDAFYGAGAAKQVLGN